MDMDQAETRSIRFDFLGSALGLFGRSLLLGLGYLVVIPVPWVMAWFFRWFVGNLRMSDNTEMSFVGEGRQIWFPVISLALLNLAGRFVSGLWVFLVFVVIVLLSCYVAIVVMRWFCGNIVLSDRPRLSFSGKFLDYLGWTILMFFSIFTIIGWAWVVVAMYRWMCRNVVWEGHQVAFNGSGWGLLWRGLIFAVTCVLIIPIPWTALWIAKWYIHNVSVRPIAAEQGII